MLLMSILFMYFMIGMAGIVLSYAAIAILTLLYYILYAIGSYNIFVKAKRPGWWAFIPLFNEYQLFKMAWSGSYFFINIILNFFASSNQSNDKKSFLATLCGFMVVMIQLSFTNKLAKAYGKSTLFGLGLFFFQPIFIILLGFSDAKYRGPQI